MTKIQASYIKFQKVKENGFFIFKKDCIEAPKT